MSRIEPALERVLFFLGGFIRRFLNNAEALWLIAVATLPFLFLLRGEYLFDDIQVIESNASLKSVRSLWDCFTFVLKPSKPITNFWLAVGQWLGAGAPFAQRLLSIIFHAGTVLLVFGNLKFLLERTSDQLPKRFPFWVALLFAVAPIHTETLVVALFRMEILGTFFTLLACLAFQTLLVQPLSKRTKAAWFTVLFLSMGLGPLSKETFLVILPVALWCVASVPGDRRFSWRVPAALGLVQGFWGVLLSLLLRRDAEGEFPYRDVVGIGLVEWTSHVRLAASALLEVLHKTVTGHGLTVLRLRDRISIGQDLDLLGALLVLSAACASLVGLYRLGGLTRLFALWVGVGIGVYLAIPNINIGSEHYAYFPAVGIFGLLVLGGWRLIAVSSRRASAVAGVMVFGYALALGLGLGARLRNMDSRLSFYLSEAQLHPENAAVWSDVALAFMERRPAAAREARPFLENARRLSPDHPNTRVAEFLLNYYDADLDGAERAMREIEPLFSDKPKTLARFHLHLDELRERVGRINPDETSGTRAAP